MPEPPKTNPPDGGDTAKSPPYKIPEEYTFVDCYGRGSIYSQRVGYTLLSMVDYKTKAACGSIKFPLPDTFHIPSDAQWNSADEDGLNQLAAQALDLSKEGALDPTKAGTIVGDVAARFAAKTVMDMPFVKGLLRSQGLAYNPNKQMYYGGPEFGSQQFSFKLMPRNAKEALLMYEVCKIIYRCSLPGSSTLSSELGNVIEQIGSKLGAGQQATEWSGKLQQMFGSYDVTKGMASPFFSYPNLWNIAIFVTQEGRSGHAIDKCVFQWNTLALVNYRIDFGSNIKWHADGFPTSVTVTMQMTETVIKTAQNLDAQMPHIII